MNLDINTPKGQETLPQEAEVFRRIKSRWGFDVVQTNKKREACYDGVIVDEGIIKSVIEVKCRTFTYAHLKWLGSWLITEQKIKDCATVAKLSAVPFTGFLYLVPDDIILYWKITNDRGEYLFDIGVEKTKTQKNINGGLIERDNAFLPLKYAKQL